MQWTASFMCLIHMPHSSLALTTAQLAFPKSTQWLSAQAPGVGTQGFVPQPGWTAAKEAWDPTQPTVTWQMVWVEVSAERSQIQSYLVASYRMFCSYQTFIWKMKNFQAWCICVKWHPKWKLPPPRQYMTYISQILYFDWINLPSYARTGCILYIK